jgi:hypothetical protein
MCTEFHKTIAGSATPLRISAFATVKMVFEMGTETNLVHRSVQSEMVAHQARLKNIRESLQLYRNRRDR